MTPQVAAILEHYSSCNAGVKSQLFRLLNAGALAGSGKLLILPVDQGFEHGPDRSFLANPPAYAPEYHAQLAYENGLSAFAAPLGMLEMVAHKYAGKLPLILKINSANSIGNSNNAEPNQAVTASIKQALKLGCVAVGLTIYPGSAHCNEMLEKARHIIENAHENGLAAIVWAYPRGKNIDKVHESALDIVSYAAHLGCLIGADIIKVKLPTNKVLDEETQRTYHNCGLDIENSDLITRVSHVMRAAFHSQRIVLFSGGANKDALHLMSEIQAIVQGGGHGSIIGRNIFQRPRAEASKLLAEIIKVYKKTPSESNLNLT